ncbi:MAG: ASPIC/UnbV domain-containing protein, partial [Marinirhabdus sp.]|nr:ASPIC/UnbV domain-containing protein [Marinirhabdus sp.]
NNFYENDGNGNFVQMIETTGINKNDLGSWENLAADFNNDGYMDILSEMSSELYLGNGDLTFTGQDLPFDEGGIGDFNNDGFLDVVRGGNLYINDGNTNNYIKMTLVGEESNINGIGARVTITGAWGSQMRELRSGQGFQHMNSLNVHFGIGTATTIDEVMIEWPNGTVDIFEDVAPNQSLVVTEGETGTTMGIDDINANLVSVFPNPTASALNFSMEGLQDTPVTIIDVNGKLVLNTTISSSNSIDVSALKSGVYFVQFEMEDQRQSIKFVKK